MSGISFNITGVRDWGTDFPFNNHFKSARDWQLDAFDANPLPDEYRDENGYPNEMPPGSSIIRTTWAFREGTPFAEGPWVLTWEGESTFTLGGVSNQVITDHRIEFDNPTGDPIGLDITAITGGGGHAKNFKLMLAENEAAESEGKIFTQRFLDLFKGSGGNPLRFMDWMLTNDSPVETWADMPQADYFSYVPKGVPLSVIIELANELNIDPYICIPHQADDNLVEQAAALIHANLNPNLKVYVQDSNETWNGYFTQTGFREAQGVAALWTNPSEGTFGQGQQFCGYRAAQIMEIFRAEWGTDSGEGWIGVLDTWPAVPYHTGLRLEGVEYHIDNDPDVPVGTTVDKLFSALAITTYFGDNLLADATNREDLVSYIESHTEEETFDYVKGLMLDPEFTSSIPANTVFWEAQKTIADNAGLELIAYEGGTHVLHAHGINAPIEQREVYEPVLIAFSFSPQIAELYDAGFDVWEALTNQPYTDFVLMSPAGQHGAFGSLQYYGDMNERYGCISARARTLPYRENYVGVTAEVD